MGLLAYDPARLARLLAEMRAAADELRGVSCPDPAAARAIHLVRTTTAALELDWIPLVTRIVLADPLHHGAQVRGGIRSLTNSPAHIMTTQHGWAVQFDPLADDRLVVTLEEARALAQRLQDADTIDTEDRDEMHWLAAQLAIIARDPASSAAFLDMFDNWAPFVDALAHARLSSPIDERGHIDAVLAGLGEVARYRVSPEVCSAPQTILPGLDEMHPYSAALMVQYMGLEGLALAQVADHILRRWVAMPYEPPLEGFVTDIHWPEQRNTADLLFPLLLADATAGTAFVHLAADHPEVLFTAAHDTDVMFQIVLRATDPATAAAADAGHAILPILEFVSRSYDPWPGTIGYAPGWREFLIDLIAPWTMQFSPQNTGFTTDTDQKERLLAFVVRDDESVDRLLERADELQRGVLASLDLDDVGVWVEFAAYVGMLARLITRQRVRDEERAAAAFGLVLEVVGLAANALPGSGFTASVVLGAAARLNPFDPERVAADAGYAEDCLLTTAAAAVAQTVHAQWVATGVLPAGFPPPPTPRANVDDPGNHFVADLREWTATLPTLPDGRNLEAEINGFTAQTMGAAAAAAFGAD